MTSLLTTTPVLCVLIVLLSSGMAAKDRKLSPLVEAQQIAVDATEALLPDPALVTKIMEDVKIIRSQNKNVAKTLNHGNKPLGQVQVNNYNSSTLDKVATSTLGPATASEVNGITAVLTFPKPYNPDKLVQELEKLGVKAQAIWFTGPDYGHIRYSSEAGTYTFREGLENCKPKCRDNHFWVYKVVNGQSVLDGEYATDIPEIRTAPPK